MPTQRQLPQAIIRADITDTEQLSIRFKAEYSEIYFAKQHEWTATDINPGEAVLSDSSKWIDRARSHSRSIGFGLKIVNS